MKFRAVIRKDGLLATLVALLFIAQSSGAADAVLLRAYGYELPR